MKTVFAEAMQQSTPSFPLFWGWGLWESRLLPRMPDVNRLVVLGADDHMSTHGQDSNDVGPVTADMSPLDSGMHTHEMYFHLMRLPVKSHASLKLAMVVGDVPFLAKVLTCIAKTHSHAGIAFLFDGHWQPIVLTKEHGHLGVSCEPSIAETLRLSGFTITLIAPDSSGFCGATTWSVLAELCGYEVMPCSTQVRRLLLKSLYTAKRSPALHGAKYFGYGPQGQLMKNLIAELSKHGIPDTVIEERACAAIKTLGSEQIMNALAHRQPWKQLKILGNNSKFQFVMPSELAKVVEENKGKVVSSKGKGKGKGFRPLPQPVELDPSKLQVLPDTFHSNGTPMHQLTMKQIGPISSGLILMSLHEAEPYLKAGVPVSREPLALLVLQKTGVDIQSALPHVSVTVPCRCTVNNEPMLVEATLVQVGTGIVEKVSGQALVSVDTPDVVTLKIMVYKDELKGDWNDFISSPIRCLVSLLPQLKRCFTENCTCPAWHNPDQLPLRDPIIDVWRRQFLRGGFKPCPAIQSEVFSVCIRIPVCLLEPLLSTSGSYGAYCEPRTADGREILPEYTVIWTPKHTLQEMQHLMQTNPAVTGLARLGERRGLRVHTNQAKSIHQLVRPDSVFLPGGPKSSFVVGPFPYGVDRFAVGKVLRSAGWECRPLQPANPCPGRGVMWLVQSTEDPENAIISTTSGDIVINKQKQEPQVPTKMPSTVGPAATVALCGTDATPKTEGDPWALHDPWRRYQATQQVSPITAPAEGMLQIEERIQNAVLAKMQPPMERDDMPDRVQTLEGQVHQLLSKQQGLESQFHEFSGQHTQQINALQGQVAAQAQQLHGHLENQNQNMQSLFEQQMQQIRGLLAKRPREEGME